MSLVIEMFAAQSELLGAMAHDLRDAIDRWGEPDAVDRVRRVAKVLEDIAAVERDEVAQRLLFELDTC